MAALLGAVSAPTTASRRVTSRSDPQRSNPTAKAGTTAPSRAHFLVRTVILRLDRVKSLSGFDPLGPAHRFRLPAAVLGVQLPGGTNVRSRTWMPLPETNRLPSPGNDHQCSSPMRPLAKKGLMSHPDE